MIEYSNGTSQSPKSKTENQDKTQNAQKVVTLILILVRLSMMGIVERAIYKYGEWPLIGPIESS